MSRTYPVNAERSFELLLRKPMGIFSRITSRKAVKDCASSPDGWHLPTLDPSGETYCCRYCGHSLYAAP